MTEYEGYIVYPTYKVENGKSYIYLFGRLKSGESFCTKNHFVPYFFIKKDDVKSALEIEQFEHQITDIKNFEEEQLIKIVKQVPKEVVELRKKLEEKGISCYEADVRFEYRFMMDKDLKGTLKIHGTSTTNENIRTDLFFEEPKLKPSFWKAKSKDLKILSVDIETSMDALKLYCISLYSNDKKLNTVLIISTNDKLKNSEICKDEKEMLLRFKELLIDYNPDVVTGWNVIDFDFKILSDKMKKLGIEFDLGRNKDKATFRISDSFMIDSKADFPGRMVLDGIHLMKSSFVKLDDYKLGTAAKEFTSYKKLIGDENKGDDIENAYKNDQQKLIDYNLLDAKLVIEIIEKSGVMDLTLLRSFLTGMPLERVRASIASLDSLYLRKLRQKGYAALSKTFVQRGKRTTGGYVMTSKPGIYDYVIVCDFKSLYPSIMITFNIDPWRYRPEGKNIIKGENLIEAPNGAHFSKEEGILPEILKELWKERDVAKKNKDELTRAAIKILMNSMYGVMASPNCRFYSFEMANSITSFAHKMIKTTAKVIEDMGYEVIYGDTDSTFVNLNVDSVEEAMKIGKQIEKESNQYLKKMISKDYGVDSYLELEFEKTFKKFLMPTVRGSDAGAKKRYAGLLVTREQGAAEQNSGNSSQHTANREYTEKMDFTGLEFVRRDWTELSKKFQLTLLDKIFHEEEVTEFVKKFVIDLKKGKYDDLLVYRKALRKNVDDYVKTTPPHVKAARKLGKITSNIIDYVMTTQGPEPIQKIENSLDYEHYIEKQIKPIADSVLGFFDTNFDDLIKGSEQKNLFNY